MSRHSNIGYVTGIKITRHHFEKNEEYDLETLI